MSIQKVINAIREIDYDRNFKIDGHVLNLYQVQANRHNIKLTVNILITIWKKIHSVYYMNQQSDRR